MPIRLTKTIKVFLGAYFFIFLIQQTGDQFFGTQLMPLFGLSVSGFFESHRLWQLVTYSFVHRDVWHLFFNMMLIAFIGGELEISWGRARFLKYYFFCSTVAGSIFLLLESILSKAPHSHALMVGSSGAIYGLLMAYGLIFGERILLFMMLFPMKAKHFVWILALIELMTTIYSPRGGLSGVAHLGGMAGGFAYLWIRARWILSKRYESSLSPARKNQTRKRKFSKHLKLIVNNKPDFDSVEKSEEKNPRTWH